ncbi:MAG: glycosyltransferase [Candidatus Electrothrix sp. AW1]|nr:glycosyltransferase [Candidatus Electrothrix sp. AX1]MCI5181528.1 glycosyltransferase [Candidatus Electrothrix gigas]
MPRVSVVIPCYNQGIFVDEAIESVLAQTWQDFEIIIVNDGSTDLFTVQHLQQLDFPKTQVIHTDNQGLSSARNNGIQAAQGEYILPLDADDRIGSTYLEQAVPLLDNDVNVGIVYCKAQLFGDVTTEWLLPEFSLQRILLDNIIFCTAFFRKTDWEEVGGFDPAMIYGWEDYDFWLSLLEMGRKVFQIKEILFYYRVAADSMVRTQSRQHKVESFARIFRKHQKLYTGNIEVWIDKLLDITAPYHQALLLPKKDKAPERERAEEHPECPECPEWVRKVHPGVCCLQFELSKIDQSVFLFQPADSQVILRVKDVFLVDTTSTKYEIPFTHTADFSQDDLLFFCTSEPLVQLTLPDQSKAEGSQYLSIQIEYVAFGQDCLPLLGNLFSLLKKHIPHQTLISATTRSHSTSWPFELKMKWFLKTLLYRLSPARRRTYRLLKQSGLVDKSFYLRNDPELVRLSIDPLVHYMEYGWQERRSPNPLFDPDFYQKTYAEKFTLANSNVNVFHPLEHYQQQGVFAGHYPCQKVADLPNKPIISLLVPVFNIDKELLQRCIHSVQYQAYPHWELCLVDDGSSAPHIRPLLEQYAARDRRIKVSFLEKNSGISLATNKAAELATGEYLGFLDHDDELTLDALYRVVEAINRVDPDVLYSDEELINRQEVLYTRFYKPDYNPELLLCHNYITHFFVTKKSLFRQVGGLLTEYNGAQDYDLALKITEQTKKIHHIRCSLYRWRATKTSTSINHEQKEYAAAAGLKAVQNAVKRRGIQAEVKHSPLKYYYQVQRHVKKRCQISVFVRIPDNIAQPREWLRNWLESLLASSDYPYLDYMVLHRGSVEKLKELEELLIEQPEKLASPINFYQRNEQETEAAALNRLADNAVGEYLIFLGQGALPQETNWVETLLGYAQTEEYGVVSGFVAQSDKELKHLAVPDLTDMTCHAYRSLLVHGSSHLNGFHCPQNVITCSFDFCMVKRSSFIEMQGFDAKKFPEYLFDIDFCLRLREVGRKHVFTPYCTALITMPEQKFAATKNWLDEKRDLQRRWRTVLQYNPYYNENRLLTELKISRKEWLHWIAGV